MHSWLRKNLRRNLIKQLKSVLLLILTLIVLPHSFACGDKTTTKAILSNIQGEVLVKRAGSIDWVKAEDQMVLAQGDALKSGTAASAMVTFFDGSIIELKANTQIEIRELLQGKPSNIKLKQELGETISKVGKLVDPASRYEIETPAAIAAVRGSSMLVRVVPDGTTTVQNLEGKISVIAKGIEVSIPEGGTSTVKPGEPPGPISYSAIDGFITGRGNPNGVWSYGWMPIDFSVFNIYTSQDISVFKKYAPPNLVSWYAELGSDRTPCIWVNTGDPAYGAPTSWLSLHPGPGRQPSVLRWTTPFAGNIRISGEFLPGDSRSMTVGIRHKSQEIWSATDSGSFTLLENVTAGDTIDFMVYGGYNYGNTPLRSVISY